MCINFIISWKEWKTSRTSFSALVSGQDLQAVLATLNLWSTNKKWLVLYKNHNTKRLQMVMNTGMTSTPSGKMPIFILRRKFQLLIILQGPVLTDHPNHTSVSRSNVLKFSRWFSCAPRVENTFLQDIAPIYLSSTSSFTPTQSNLIANLQSYCLFLFLKNIRLFPTPGPYNYVYQWSHCETIKCIQLIYKALLQSWGYNRQIKTPVLLGLYSSRGRKNI